MILLCCLTAVASEPRRRERWQNWTVEHGLPSNHVLSVWRARDGGYLWVGTDAGLARFNGLSFRVVGPPLAITSLAATADGRLWAGTRSDGVFLVSGFELERVAALEPLQDMEIVCLAGSDDGALWIGAANGLGRYTLADGLRVFRVSDGLPHKRVRSIRLAGRDRIVADTVQGAVLAAPLGALSRALESPSTTGSKSLLDTDGNLWTPTAQGLERLRHDDFSTLGSAEGLPSDDSRAIVPARNGGYWIGTAEGLYHSREGTITGVPKAPVYSVAELPDGTVYVGTHGSGLWRRRSTGPWMPIAVPGGGPLYVLVIRPAREGGVWVGTAGGLFRILPDDRLIGYYKQDGMASNGVHDVLEAQDGHTWAATNAGLSEWTGTLWRIVSELGRRPLFGIAEAPDHSGILLAGKDGMLAWDGVRLRALEVDELACTGRAFSVLPHLGGIWWVGDRGVCRGSLSEGSLRSVLVARIPGVHQNAASQPSALRAADGALWFATSGGVLRIAPGKLRGPATLGFERVFVNGRPVTPAGALDVPPGEETVEIQYAALELVHPELVRYRYRLSGLDRNWIDAGRNRSVTYSHLPRRAYRFEVSARGDDGNWSRPAVLLLDLQPYFYQTGWFAAVLALALMGSAAGIHAWRVRAAERRLTLVLEERARIARELHDTLAQSIGGISVQLEAAKVLAGTAPAKSGVHIDRARGLASSALDEVRSFVRDLRHSPHASGPIEDALKAIARAAGAEVSVTVSGDTRALSEPLRECLFRVAQEAVRNSLRHGAAQRVQIRLNYESDLLRMVVWDDGTGFAPELTDQTLHYGLAGMRERSERVGGTFRVASSPGHGCEIEVEVPYA